VSLSGSIEDLPLLEILQVVSFCQKTGHLTVQAPGGDAGVVFESGRVVSGYVWDVPGLAGDEPPAGPAREKLVRERIAGILEKLVRLREGEFAFTLDEAVPRALGGRDLSGEMLPYGINPEELMLDLARKLDEDRRDAAAALEATFAAPVGDDLDDVVLEALPPEAEEERPAGPVVLLVDDEPDVCRIVGDRLQAAGFSVASAGSPATARREMDRLAASRMPFLLVVDLGLPPESGTSFRGGLDVAKAASGLAARPPVLLMADTLDEKLRARAKRLGVSLLAFKPGLSKLDPLQYEADLRAFADKLARDLLPRLEGRRRRDDHALRPPPPAAAAPGAEGREEVLRSALEEMERSPDPDLVAFLLVRAARAFFPRVLLLVVKDDRLRGLSGFGPSDSADSLDLLARNLSVPLEPPSPLSDAVASGRAWTGPLPADGPLRGLLDRVGALDATAAAVVPVRAHRETIALLYGDAPDGATPPPLEPLVAFVEKAGRTLEGSLLARRTPAPASG
jgi:CheY-like chemotaxis protein